ncbi:unnamed protein product [Adineta ricciae]|uniref:MARVEL domain-containing protein n=1 Tax=Adineta ricciae TaxID=249248 RepID=A0A813Q8L0_ADIRI|nr:unnamed protein product [Adineta ricciae]CAF1151161.1 unnamed protein product [Adineta ricciae]
MVDKSYIVSLLGCANLIELTLLTGGFIAVCVASTGYGQLVDSSSNLSQTNNADLTIFYDINVYTIKQADQGILITIFLLTFCSLFAHIIFAFRYRYSWHRLSTVVAVLCVIYAFAILVISILVACWEDKMRKRLTNSYVTNSILSTSNPSIKPQIGSAAAAATFGFAACLAYLAEALIRFRRLADKIQT